MGQFEDEFNMDKKWTDHEARVWMDHRKATGQSFYTGVSADNVAKMLKLQGWSQDAIDANMKAWNPGYVEGKQAAADQLIQDERFSNLLGFQQKQYRDLTREFNHGAELAAASQTRGMMTRARQGLGAAGLEGPMAEAMMLREQGKIAEATALEQNAFASQLKQMHASNLLSYKRESYSFFDAIQKMETAHQFNISMTRFQDRLSQDRESRGQFFDMLGSIGGLAARGAVAYFSGGVSEVAYAGKDLMGPTQDGWRYQ